MAEVRLSYVELDVQARATAAVLQEQGLAGKRAPPVLPARR